MLPTQRRCSDPGFVLFEDADELVLGELAPSHCVHLGDSPRENAHDAWTSFRGGGQPDVIGFWIHRWLGAGDRRVTVSHRSERISRESSFGAEWIQTGIPAEIRKFLYGQLPRYITPDAPTSPF
jgi:hypothetical protein